MRKFVILLAVLLFVGVTAGYIMKDSTNKNAIRLAGKAIQEIYEKHSNELKNFGPFLEDYYKHLPRLETETNELKESIDIEETGDPLPLETVFADSNPNEYLL